MMQAPQLSSDRTVKGSHIAVAVERLDARLEPGATVALAREHGADWNVVLPVAQYDIEVLLRVLDEASARTGTSVAELSTEIARENAARDLRSIYKLFLRVMQPTAVLKQTPRLWRTYVAFAEASALVNEPGHYVGEGVGYEQRDVPWAEGCWLGFIPFAVEMAGGKRVQARILKRERLSSGLYKVQAEVRYS